MGWSKRPRVRPVVLGNESLNGYTTPGDTLVQKFAAYATRANGFPWEQVAGTCEVKPWNPDNGSVIAVFYAWTGAIATRTFYQGVWRPWRDATGKAVE